MMKIKCDYDFKKKKNCQFQNFMFKFNFFPLQSKKNFFREKMFTILIIFLKCTFNQFKIKQFENIHHVSNLAFHSNLQERGLGNFIYHSCYCEVGQQFVDAPTQRKQNEHMHKLLHEEKSYVLCPFRMQAIMVPPHPLQFSMFSNPVLPST